MAGRCRERTQRGTGGSRARSRRAAEAYTHTLVRCGSEGHWGGAVRRRVVDRPAVALAVGSVALLCAAVALVIVVGRISWPDRSATPETSRLPPETSRLRLPTTVPEGNGGSQATLADLTLWVKAYTLPWAMYHDATGHLWLRADYPVTTQAEG